MELTAAIRARRMVRSFRPDPIAPALVDELLDLARRSPSAGNTDGLAFLVLDDAEAVGRYWEATLPPDRRAGFPWPGLLRAPVLVVPCAHAGAYVARYGEPDKARRRAASAAQRRGLAAGPEGWAVPYWLVDTSMATMALLLAAVDAGLGACFFGIFEHEPAVRKAFAIPDGFDPIGTVALGYPDGADRRSGSTRRRRPPLEDIVHRGRWRAGEPADPPADRGDQTAP